MLLLIVWYKEGHYPLFVFFLLFQYIASLELVIWLHFLMLIYYDFYFLHILYVNLLWFSAKYYVRAQYRNLSAVSFGIAWLPPAQCCSFDMYSSVAVQLYSPDRPLVDIAEVFLWLMAVGTILCACYWSAWSAREASIEHEKLLKVLFLSGKHFMNFIIFAFYQNGTLYLIYGVTILGCSRGVTQNGNSCQWCGGHQYHFSSSICCDCFMLPHPALQTHVLLVRGAFGGSILHWWNRGAFYSLPASIPTFHGNLILKSWWTPPTTNSSSFCF